MDERRYAETLQQTVQDWVRREFPTAQHELAEHAARVAVGLFERGASLGDACRIAYAFVVDHASERVEALGEEPRPSPAEE